MGFGCCLNLLWGICVKSNCHIQLFLFLSVSLFLPFLTFLFLSFFVYFPFLLPSPSLFLRMRSCLCISLFCLHMSLFMPIYLPISIPPHPPISLSIAVSINHILPLPPNPLLLSATSSRGTDDHGEPPIRHDKVQTLRNMTSVL